MSPTGQGRVATRRRTGRAGPTRAELLAAAGRTVPDVVAPDLRVLFSGINPGLYSAWAGHHFARPGNRFWPTLHTARFTPRLLAPSEERALLELGYGITNIVTRATATAAELSPNELAAGAGHLRDLVLHHRPHSVAILGVSAYRAAFGDPNAGMGRQPARWGETIVWVLPNPSGLNAHYQAASLARLFRTLRRVVEAA
jgi:double-stranded uracil-DNA glycosylase